MRKYDFSNAFEGFLQGRNLILSCIDLMFSYHDDKEKKSHTIGLYQRRMESKLPATAGW